MNHQITIALGRHGFIYSGEIRLDLLNVTVPLGPTSSLHVVEEKIKETLNRILRDPRVQDAHPQPIDTAWPVKFAFDKAAELDFEEKLAIYGAVEAAIAACTVI